MLTKVTKSGWSKRNIIARFISDVANPFFIAPAVLVVLAVFQRFTLWQITGIVILSTLFYTIIPLVVLLYWQRKTNSTDYDLIQRQQRIGPYGVVMLSYGIAGLLIIWLLPDGSDFIKYAAFCYLLNPLIGFLITLGWKVSLHSASVGTALAILFWYPTVMHSSFLFMAVYYSILIGLFTLLPMIMWSRLQLNVHTFNQVFAGALLGFLVSSGVLTFMI